MKLSAGRPAPRMETNHGSVRGLVPDDDITSYMVKSAHELPVRIAGVAAILEREAGFHA